MRGGWTANGGYDDDIIVGSVSHHFFITWPGRGNGEKKVETIARECGKFFI